MDSLVAALLLASGVVLASIAVTTHDYILLAVAIVTLAIGVRELRVLRELLRRSKSGEQF